MGLFLEINSNVCCLIFISFVPPLYKCLHTGDRSGLIEVVTNCTTLARIQKAHRGARGAFSHSVLMKYLEEHNTTPAALEESIENFTASCAGYSVATYVLGVGDRHSDNILLKKSGEVINFVTE